jgi:hypothetical protein
MKQESFGLSNDTPLGRKLLATGRLALLTETTRAAGLVLAGLIAMVLLMLTADVVFSLKPWALVSADMLVALCLLAGFVYVAWTTRRNSYDPRRAARMIENRLGIQDSRIINAALLAGVGNGLSFASADLTREVVSRGDQAAAGIVPSRVIDAAALKKALAALAIAAVVMAVSYAVVPGAFNAAIPRFLRPTAGLAPFTLVRFDVEVLPRKIYFGQPVSIFVRLSGPDLPDRADVVFSDSPGTGSQADQRAPMVRGDDGRFVVRLERAERSRDFYIDTPSGRSDKFRLVVHPVPQFEQAGVGYEYPSYTHWPPSAVAIEASGIGAIEGTTAVVTIKSNLPLAQSLLELIPAGVAGQTSAGPEDITRRPSLAAACEPGICKVPSSGPAGAPAAANIIRVPLKPDAHDPTTVQGSFPIRFSGQFRISLMGTQGVPGATTLQGPLTCTPDAWPKIQIAEPTGLLVAPEDWKVHVAITAGDDVAVRKITISRSVNGWGPATKELPLQSTGPTYAAASEDFDLAALGAKGGDVITFFATAHDNYPSVEHFTDTPVVVIHVITKQEYTDLARTKYRMEQITAEIDAFRAKLDEIDKARAELLAEIEALKKKIAAGGGKASEADLRKLEELDAKYAKYAQRSQELAREMIQRSKRPQIYDFEAEYAKMLRDTGDKLLDQADAADKLRDVWAGMKSANPAAPNAPRYAGMVADQLKQDGDKTQQTDQNITTAKEDLSKIQQADKMVALVERVGAIAYQQRELAERMAQFRNRETLSAVEQIRARRMAEDQVQIERDLAETLEQMDQQAAESAKVLPKMSASVKELAQNVRDLKVRPDQQDASRLAQAGQGRYAWQVCDGAATKLESLIKESGGAQGMMGQACEDCRLQLVRGNLMQSLRQLAQGRGIPGMGDEGQGKQKGGQGEGYYGSRANMTMLGPHQASGGASNAAGTGGRAGNGSGHGGSVNKPSSPHETLKPGQTPAHESSGGAAAGVPVKYRDLSEAYFRRLADESK